MTIDVSSIGIKFENFMQAGCRNLGSQSCTAESPLFCPNWYSFLEHFYNCHAVLPSIICDWNVFSGSKIQRFWPFFEKLIIPYVSYNNLLVRLVTKQHQMWGTQFFCNPKTTYQKAYLYTKCESYLMHR